YLGCVWGPPKHELRLVSSHQRPVPVPAGRWRLLQSELLPGTWQPCPLPGPPRCPGSQEASAVRGPGPGGPRGGQLSAPSFPQQPALAVGILGLAPCSPARPLCSCGKPGGSSDSAFASAASSLPPPRSCLPSLPPPAQLSPLLGHPLVSFLSPLFPLPPPHPPHPCSAQDPQPLPVGPPRETELPRSPQILAPYSEAWLIPPVPVRALTTKPLPVTVSPLEQWRLRKRLGMGLSRGQGRWVPTCQAERRGPAVTPCPGAELGPEPWQVQTNLASPWPRPGLALKDWTGLLTNSGSQQQSNVWPRARRPQGGAQAWAVRQSNLSAREAGLAGCGGPRSPHVWSGPQERWPCPKPWERPSPRGSLTCPPSARGLPQLPPTGSPCPGSRPAAGFASPDGHAQLDPRSRCGPGEPLTLEDLAVHAPSRAPAPSQAAIHQLLVAVRRLELEVARLRSRESREPPGSAERGRWTRDGQAPPASRLPCRPALASWDERKQSPRALGETGGFPETQGGQAGRSALLGFQPAAAVQMFRSLVALSSEATGSGSCLGAEPAAAVARGPVGVVLGPKAPGGPAGGGVDTTHTSPAGPELPRGQGSRVGPRERQATAKAPREGGQLFLLWCHQKERARLEQRGREEPSLAPWGMQRLERPPQARRPPVEDAAAVAPLTLWSQRVRMCRVTSAACLAQSRPAPPSTSLAPALPLASSRCFGAWQRFLQRGTRYRHHLVARRTGALRVSLQQWVRMKQLRATDGAKVTQLSLCWQKAGARPGLTAGSLQEAGPPPGAAALEDPALPAPEGRVGVCSWSRGWAGPVGTVRSALEEGPVLPSPRPGGGPETLGCGVTGMGTTGRLLLGLVAADAEGHPEGLALEGVGSGHCARQHRDHLDPGVPERLQHTPKLAGEGEGQGRIGRGRGGAWRRDRSREQDPTPPSPGFQGPRSAGRPPGELPAGSRETTAAAVKAQQSRGAARWHQRSLQRR
ncbi:hypothetical protein J0S82_016323, partial [Galemys pyrenaicus]